ncbi:SCO family protein [Glacieibacterium sp.]|uniref:SCO family protein n=1 Tax=Glacieibacterium sp. TaxID=2860237 RepID=UPI003B00E600
MNSRRSLLLVAILLGVALLAGTLMLASRPAAPAGPLVGSNIGGPFSLIDQNGKPFTDRDLQGRYALVYFGYTFCPDVCPLDTQKMSAGLAAFEKQQPLLGAKVVPVFITVDPERDTPAVLKQFTSAFHPRLVGLTGSVAAIDAAKSAYRIYAKRAGPPGAKDYLMDHMAVIYLMGPDGKPISFLGHDATVAQVTDELVKYVR